MEMKVKSYNYKLLAFNMVSTFHLHMHLLVKLQPGKAQALKSHGMFGIGSYRF